MMRHKLEGSYVKLLTRAARRIFPDIRTISGSPTSPEVVIQDRTVLLICSPNYLGLAEHPAVIDAFQEATWRYGAGTVGSGIISGYTAAHRQVEEDLAHFMNQQAAIFFNAVSDASAGVITAIVNPPLLPILEGVSADDLGSCAVFVDSQNHASILDAVRLAKPDKTYVYRHCDVEQLEQLLRRSSQRRKLVITDGYFSMSARVAPLVEIADLCEQYDAMLFVDDAHGTGVFGATGRGTPEMLGVEDRVDFWIGSTAKGLGVRGGYIAGPKELMDYLRISSRRYVFSGTLPAAIPAAVSQALKTAEVESWRRRRVQSNANKLRNGLRELGCEVMGEGHIVPWFIGDDFEVDRISHILEQHGVFASAVRFPAVAKGEAIVRFMLMASHTDEHIERTLEACSAALYGMQPKQCAAAPLQGGEPSLLVQPGVPELAASL
ncbi:MAG: aminotransferase class I/II-fold pyridoxal phosphate-dependent enzyme [Candidatus Korobacteraceae bacterium]